MKWWETYFDENYLKLYSHTEKNAPFEVEGIIKLLGIKPAAEILDLGCGFGRHSIVLASKGFNVTGLDLSESVLQQARRKADMLKINLELVKQDMRDIPHFNKFDAVINLFTAFGIFDTEAEDLLVLQGVAKALKPGGQFLIDTINRDYVVHTKHYQSWDIDNGSIILEERLFDFFRSRLEITHQLVDNNCLNRKLESSFRLYTLTEMLDMFSQTGLTLTNVYGNFDGSQYTGESPRMILVARREP